MNPYLMGFSIAAIVAFLMTPVAKRVAKMIGAIDVPKDARRVHTKPIPRLGGLAIFIGYSVSRITLGQLGILPYGANFLPIMAGALVIILMGMVDDSKGVSAKTKFMIEMMIAIFLIGAGVRIDFLSLGTWAGDTAPYFYYDYLLFPLTAIWIVGITNTVNLIDGLDGLSCGVSGIASIALFAVASLFVGQDLIYPQVMATTAVLAGAAFGFLPFNFNPARIFMGDTGALFLGYMLAVVSIQGVMKSITVLWIILPILILGLPIFDTFFAIVRRMVNKRPIMEADKGHLHHRLLDLGLNQKQTVLLLYGITGGLGLLAYVLTKEKVQLSAWGLIGIIAVAFVLAGFFLWCDNQRLFKQGKEQINETTDETIESNDDIWDETGSDQDGTDCEGIGDGSED
jgi:UDP-GlcNAc:undecaprenyl-phosphate GlcNAc-1-phosphate transferase